MIKGHKDHLILTTLFLFLFITLSINFFHTEKTLTRNDNCPACQFQSSSLTTSQINFFHLTPPLLLGLLNSPESFNYAYILSIHPSSRSPPQA